MKRSVAVAALGQLAIRRLPGAASVLVFVLLPAFSAVAFPYPSIRVEWNNERLSVDADNAPLRRVLGTVSFKTGIQFEGLKRVRERVSLHFSLLPLEKGLKELLLHVDYAMLGDTFQPRGLRIIIVGQPRLAREQVFGPTPTRTVQDAQASRAGLLEIQHGIEVEERLPLDEAALRNALLSRDAEIQSMAFNSWFPIDYQSAVAALVEATRNKDPEVSLHALQLLAGAQHVDNKMVLATLGEALKDTSLETRIYAVSALAQREEPEVIDYLTTALVDSNVLVRMTVLQSIAPKKQARGLIEEAASGDPDPTVRDSAAVLLKQLESEGK